MCFDWTTDWPFLHLFPPLFELPYSLKCSNVEIRPVNNPIVASKCSSEGKSCMSLVLHQKLEMIKFSEEGILKAKIGQKLGLLHKRVSNLYNAK